jgi:hypothetical protein
MKKPGSVGIESPRLFGVSFWRYFSMGVNLVQRRPERSWSDHRIGLVILTQSIVGLMQANSGHEMNNARKSFVHHFQLKRNRFWSSKSHIITGV